MTRFVCRLHVVAVCLGLSLPAASVRAADAYPSPGPYGAASASNGSGSYSVAAAPLANPGSQVRMVTASDEAVQPQYGGDSTVRLIDPNAPAQARPATGSPAKPQGPPSVRAPAAGSQKYPVRQASQVTAVPPLPTPDSSQRPQRQQQPLPPPRAPAMSGESAAPAASSDEGNSDYSNCPNCPNCFCGRPGAWFGGADYMFLRPHQPGNSAFEISPNGGGGSEVNNVNFGAPFNSSFRAFLGYRTACDESIQFSYMHITNNVVESATTPDGDVINSPLGATLNPGDAIAATNHLLLNIWDVEDIRPLNLSNCNCNCCPDWQVNWSWGVRVMDLKQNVSDVVTGPDAGAFGQQSTFIGAGPRLGLEIRRQLGHTATSAFVSADAALLVGDQRTTGSDTATGLHSVQAVPDFDFRVGLSWQPTCHISVTGGWIFETFSDSTMLSQSAGLALLQPPQTSSLSYDGLFVRGEFSF